MKCTAMFALALATTLAAGSAFAQQSTAPGQRLNDTTARGGVRGDVRGASTYSPGHVMKNHRRTGGTVGASSYAPGHAQRSTATRSSGSTTGSRTSGSASGTTGMNVGGAASGGMNMGAGGSATR